MTYHEIEAAVEDSKSTSLVWLLEGFENCALYRPKGVA